ncbi:MAG TPA: FAD-binding oxidoreductase [Herpetosiphonaceae bacterium]|nr:FAD-binding oxidoreductase [Herpetosiphonaceae bacterium]
MRRWNGWGDETRHYHVSPSIETLLGQLVGPATPPRDATLAEVVASVPPTRLPDHPLVSADAAERVRHARGQSFPDLVATRSGRIGVFPDGVAFPQTSAEVRELLDYARANGVRVIPYGGGTSVVGHINPQAGDQPVLTLNLSRLSRLIDFDPRERLATFGAGVAGPDLEAELRARGYTLGHFPQSFELSTLGGWIASRSSGQQSLGFGRIEQLWAGGRIETPSGPLDLPPFPASAAGPDVREMLLGSEGRMGVITEATVRVQPLPEHDDVHAIFFPTWEQAQTAARQMVQSRAPLSMLRLSTPTETMTNLALASQRRLIGLLERGLAWRGAGAGKCMLLAGVMGGAAQVKLSRQTILRIAGGHGGIHLGRALGKQWQKGRFRAPYLRNSLWERGYAVDTLETATTWNKVTPLLESVEGALRAGLAGENERVHAFTHLSHFYASGSSIYTTYVFRLGRDADETMARWQALKTAASQAIVAGGGTISHQHGVGRDHAPYLAAEKGRLGMRAIQSLTAAFDPDGLLNPGVLLADINEGSIDHALA